MTHFVRFARVAFTIAAIGISACSGGGQSPSPPASVNALTLIYQQTPVAVAAQLSPGAPWTSLPVNVPSATVALGAGQTAYAIAYECPSGIANYAWIFIFEATLQDARSLTVCAIGEPIQEFSGTYDVSAIPGATSANVFLGENSAGGPVTGTYGVTATTGSTDLAITATNASGQVLAVKILRNLPVTSPNATENIPPLGPADLVQTQQPVQLATSPSGLSQSIFAQYLTAGGTYVTLAPINTATSFAVVPPAIAASNDLYLFTGAAYNAASTLLTVHAMRASNAMVTVPLPSLLNYAGPAAGSHLTFPIPAYTGFTLPQELTYSVLLQTPSTGNASTDESIYATQNYIAATANAIAIPNLSSAGGFANAAPQGATAGWRFTIYTSPSPLLNTAQFTPLLTRSSVGDTQAVTAGGTVTIP